jgi:hypothetical protein
LDSLTNYRYALRTVTYVNTSSTAATGLRTLSLQANDGSATNNLSTLVTRKINVTSGMAPVLSGVPTTILAFTEKDAATLIAPAMNVTDSDSANLTGATVKITGNYTTGQDRLTFVNSGGVTADFNTVTGTLSLSGTQSVAAYQTMLRSVTYQNTQNYPNTATRTVSFSVVDEFANTSNLATRNISVTAINDAPALIGLESTTLAYNRLDPATPITSTLIATDPDGNNLTSVTVQIAAGYQQGEDFLRFVNTATITGLFDASTGKLTLSGLDSLTNYRYALRTVTYVNISSTPTTGVRTLNFQANDGSAINNLSTLVMRNINVTNTI